MKTYLELLEVLTIQQRMKRSIQSRKTAKRAARKRKLTMKKPPSPEKVKKAVDREVRNKALSIADKQGVYKGASAGVKANIEKKAEKLIKLKKSTWSKQMRPEIKKKMKDAFRSRTSSKNPESS